MKTGHNAIAHQNRYVPSESTGYHGYVHSKYRSLSQSAKFNEKHQHFVNVIFYLLDFRRDTTRANESNTHTHAEMDKPLDIGNHNYN